MMCDARVSALLRRLSLSDDVLYPPRTSRRRFIVRGGQLRALPASPLDVLRTRALSVRGRLRALYEPFVPPSLVPPEAQSLAQLVRRRFGTEILDYIVDPFVSGVYAGDPELLSARFAMRKLGEWEHAHGSVVRGAMRQRRRANTQNNATSALRSSEIISFRNGMQQLPKAIEAALARDVRYHECVRALSFDNGWWQVTSERAGVTRIVDARSVILTIPAHRVSALVCPPSWTGALQALRDVSHAPIATVALGFRRNQVRHALDGFGVLIPHRERGRILGALFNSTMFPNRAPPDHVLINCFVGGARQSAPLTADAAVDAALHDVRVLLGALGEPTLVSPHLWLAGIPQFNLGHESVDAALRSLEADCRGLTFAGSYRSGVAVGECLLAGLEAGERH